jgi:hypothetical protein
VTIRIETKWAARAADLPRISTMLIADGYEVLFPARRIFSVYYESDRLPEYWRGEEGIVPRRKRRIRWYHSRDGYLERANYEVKITGTDGRLKFSGPTIAGEIEHHSEIVRMQGLIRDRIIRPLTLVNYVRRYFGDSSGRRFTVDHDITYRHVHQFDLKTLALGRTVRDECLAIELKAAHQVSNLNYSETVPLTRTRFSKFSRSLECLSLV